MVQQVDPAELSPGEFAWLVRKSVEKQNARVVVIDSLNGYMNAMPEEQFLTAQLHELLTYLGRRGVTTLMVVAQHGMIGEMRQGIDLTYLADTVILLRYFEALGRVRRAVSVIKKRTGPHEDTIREFHINQSGSIVGPPLAEVQGVFRGVPTYVGSRSPLMESPE